MNGIIDVILILIGNLGIDSILILLLNPKRVDSKIKDSIVKDELFIQEMVVKMHEASLHIHLYDSIYTQNEPAFKSLISEQLEPIFKNLHAEIQKSILMPETIKDSAGNDISVSMADILSKQIGEKLKIQLENMEKNQIMNQGREIEENLKKNPQIIEQYATNPMLGVLMNALPKKYQPVIMAIMASQTKKPTSQEPKQNGYSFE